MPHPEKEPSPPVIEDADKDTKYFMLRVQDYGTKQKKKKIQPESLSTAHRKYFEDPVLMQLPLLFKQQKTQGVQ